MDLNLREATTDREVGVEVEGVFLPFKRKKTKNTEISQSANVKRGLTANQRGLRYLS